MEAGTLAPNVDASEAGLDDAGAKVTCVPGAPGQSVVVTFSQGKGEWGSGADKIRGFVGRVQSKTLGADVVVFTEAMENCHSCRARVEGKKLLFTCGGDMSAYEGTVSYDADALTTEWRQTYPLPPPGITSTAPPERDVRALPCGARVTLRSLVPDERKVPRSCLE